MELSTTDRRLILLTGATGYIGGRLLKALEEAGCQVRCLARRPDYLKARVAPGTQIVQADCLAPETLVAAMEDWRRARGRAAHARAAARRRRALP